MNAHYATKAINGVCSVKQKRRKGGADKNLDLEN